MHFLDLTLPTLPENLALDEALLLEAEAGGPNLLRVWSWPNNAVDGMPKISIMDAPPPPRRRPNRRAG